MADIRSYIKSHLLGPLKQYPTVIQDTMIEIITERLEELYEYTLRFPEIISPSQDRLDILKVIADQFLFSVRKDADIQEQIDILNNILYVYRVRGSIDTIENMWKYYGGTLPKEVEVVIPSYNLFRYSISRLSGTHSFIKGSTKSIVVDPPLSHEIDAGEYLSILDKDRVVLITSHASENSRSINLSNVDRLSEGDRVKIGDYEGVIKSVIGDIRLDTTINRPGAYEIRLFNSTYPIADLKEFLLRELVAAGNEIYFTNILHMHLVEDDLIESSHFIYDITTENLLDIQMLSLSSNHGFVWSGYNQLSNSNSIISGKANLWLEVSDIIELTNIYMNTYLPYSISLLQSLETNIVDMVTETKILSLDMLCYQQYSSSRVISRPIVVNLYDSEGNPIGSPYPGYFILGQTLLGTIIN